MQSSINQNARPVLRFLKVLYRVIAVLIILLFVFVGSFFIYFHFHKETLARELLEQANNNSHGQLDFTDIYLSPFAHFPLYSVSLENLSYKFKMEEYQIADTNYMLQLEKAYLAVDLRSVVRGPLRFTALKLEGGQIDLVRLSDSSYNFTNAMAALNDPKPSPPDTIIGDTLSEGLTFTIENVILEDIYISYLDQVNGSDVKLDIQYLDAIYKEQNDTLDFHIQTHMYLNLDHPKSGLQFENRKLTLASDILMQRQDSLLLLQPTRLGFDESRFNVHGQLSYGLNKHLDLHLSVDDNDMSFTSLLLSDRGQENVYQGQLSFQSHIQHDFKSEIPQIDAHLDCKDIGIHLHSHDYSIEDINFRASFETGTADDLSEMLLQIDTLYATTKHGFLHASGGVQNLVKPRFLLNLDASVDMAVVQELFEPGFIHNASGRIKVQTLLKGEKGINDHWKIQEENIIDFRSEQLQFVATDLIELKELDGQISGRMDSLHLNQLKLDILNTNISLDGDLYGLPQFFSPEGENIHCDLRISNGKFDLVELMKFLRPGESSIEDNFPYPFTGLDIDLSAELNANSLGTFRQIPQIRANFRHCFAEIEGFLPPVELYNGYLEFSEIDSTLKIDANHFDIYFENDSLYGGCIYYSSIGAPDSIRNNAILTHLNPSYYLNYMWQDSIFGDTSYLTAVVDNRIIFSDQSDSTLFEYIDVSLKNSMFQFSRDTLHCDWMKLSLEDLYYDSERIQNTYASLSATSKIEARKLIASNLYITDFQTDVDIKYGRFDMLINKSQHLFKEGHGRILVSPFDDIPSFNISYSAREFNFDQLFERMNKEAVIQGHLNADIQLSGAGKGWENISRSINGTILLNGNDLTLTGFNLDKFSEKYTRSQNFNLLDVGAVVLAGPFGLLVTKGSDFTRLLINNKNDSTNILNLLTDIEVDRGRFKMMDVAFATKEKLFAIRGGYDLPTDSLGLVVASVDTEGKIIFHQAISGTAKEPELSDIGPLRALLKPVGNLFEDLLVTDEDIFYTGKIVHPKVKK